MYILVCIKFTGDNAADGDICPLPRFFSFASDKSVATLASCSYVSFRLEQNTFDGWVDIR